MTFPFFTWSLLITNHDSISPSIHLLMLSHTLNQDCICLVVMWSIRLLWVPQNQTVWEWLHWDSSLIPMRVKVSNLSVENIECNRVILKQVQTLKLIEWSLVITPRKYRKGHAIWIFDLYWATIIDPLTTPLSRKVYNNSTLQAAGSVFWMHTFDPPGRDVKRPYL